MIRIEGKRILLRDHLISDLEDYHRWRSDTEIMQFSVLPWSHSMDQSFIFLGDLIREQSLPDRKLYFFAVVLKEQEIVIGDAGFFLEHLTDTGGIAEIGYFIINPHWGKGYASEAASLVIDYVFHNFNIHKIIAHCDTRNRGSENVMLKSGMKKEGTFKKDRCINGVWSDSLQYSILKEEWQQNQL